MASNYPRNIFLALLTSIFVLLVLNILGYLNLYLHDLGPRDFFFRKTNFNEEKNAPSIFSGILHFFASVLLAVVASSKLKIKKRRKFWWSLSFLFLFTGLDEILRFHEKIGRAVSSTFETSGVFLFSWVIPYGIAVILLGVYFLKPLLKLPKNTFQNFMAAGLIFLLGAVGVEMFTAWYIEYNHLNLEKLLVIPDVFILSTIEELLEMTGMSLFIFSLLKFIDKYKKSGRLEKYVFNFKFSNLVNF